MTQINLNELNNMLFEQIERVNDDCLKGDDLKEQLEKSKLVTTIAKTVVDNSRLMFEAMQYSNGLKYPSERANSTLKMLTDCKINKKMVENKNE